MKRNNLILWAFIIFVFWAMPWLHMMLYMGWLHLSHQHDEGDIGVIAQDGMVVSAHGRASEIGRDILAAGGNAFDAAIATHFALAVVYQQAGNIGGGGFMVYRLNTGESGTLDFREKAPKAAHRDLYIDADGKLEAWRAKEGALSVGVPGAVAGMGAIHARFASQDWAALIAPSIALARDGFSLTPKAAQMFNRYQKMFRKYNDFAASVLRDQPWQAGEVIKFPQLAATLKRIAQNGAQEFYRGDTAKLIITTMQKQGGIITQADLSAYQPVWREPIIFDYRGHKIITMPPPSSGGIALAQLLGGIEAYNVSAMQHNSAAYIHLLTELERRVYADRATHLGDTDFVDVNIATLTSADYITARMADIKLDIKTPSPDVKAGHVEIIESVETTHISIVDGAGNAVAITTTLNGNFGAKVIVEGAGFLLNNEMDDFSIKAGHANQYGLLGNHKNEIAPEKRMLSSMTPTIVEKEGALKIVLGTPGGATIITSVFQTLLNMIDFEMTAQAAVNARKTHHQWQPDMVLMEKGAPSWLNYWGLRQRGHRIRTWPEFSYELGRLQVIRVSDKGLEGAADYLRGHDDKAEGYTK